MKLNRSRLRQLLMESLEQRQLMAIDSAAPIFAPGTPQGYVDHWIEKLGNPNLGEGSNPINLQGSRWVNPVGGTSANPGDPATVTWGIVPDGTLVPGINGTTRASDLVSFMDGIYGTSSGPVSTRPWFPIFKRAYDTWSAVSGLNFVYEPNDDGVEVGLANRGVASIRPDVRIGGRDIDGNSNILAFSFFP